MFCDLVGSTALSQRLDPEELREVIGAYHQLCAEVIHRSEGYIAQYLGDGLLVYFGFPQAHEDDARRAVRTGLQIVEGVERLNERLGPAHHVQLAVRLGVHTGLVVVGEMGGAGRREWLAVGEAPNVAARLQALAEPNAVVISATTHRLVQGFFAWEALEAPALKGLSQPLAVYRVLRESDTRAQLDVKTTRRLTPFVGRQSEIASLLEWWELAKAGGGQVALLSGEAGIGKSRLVREVHEQLAGEPHAWLECRCSAYYTNTALYPVIDLLQRMFRLMPDDSQQEKLDRLEGALAPYHGVRPDALQLFASLLSIPLGDRFPPRAMSPERHRHQTLEALSAVLMELAVRQPVLLTVEDLHWVDPSTLELLTLLMDRVPTAAILALYTCRPTFAPPWAGRRDLRRMTLSRLTRLEVARMIEGVVGGRALPTSVVEQVLTRTDGVPLFVEELSKMVVESGLLTEHEDRYELSGPLPPLAIPTTLHDSLMARLDRVAEAKTVSQLGAALGRQFSYELIRAVSPLSEEVLAPKLERLVDAGLLYQRGVPPQATYTFKHALIQETAYQSLLKSTRQQFHQQIAGVLEERFRETVETEPELLAHHYSAAGLADPAVEYWRRAGQRAIERSANVEAISHLNQALELLKTLPATSERTQRQLTLRIMLGAPLVMTKGYAAPEVERNYAQAHALCRELGETPQLFPALWGLWMFYFVRGRLQPAWTLAEQLLRLAQSVQAGALLVEAHLALGCTLFHLGELTAARAHLEQGSTLYDPEQHRFLAFRSGQDPGAACQSYAAHALWLLGCPDQALTRISTALTLAEKLAHPYSQGLVLTFRALLHNFRREVRATHEQAEATIALATEQGFPVLAALGMILRGWALTEQGRTEEGIAQIQEGLAAYQATGAELARPHRLALLADAYRHGGRVEEGLRVLAEALTVADMNGDRYYEAELHRIRGELLLRRREPGRLQAEACFRHALRVARGQQARSLELRAATSLSRLWRATGKRDEARRMLTALLGCFTEGLDTPDLQDARALLGEID
jgi:class 3 adenylate cyclase/predicted ATPase